MRRFSPNSRSAPSTPILVLRRSVDPAFSLPDGCGFSTTPCSSVTNALEILHHGHHRAVLCDLDMPRASRTDLVKTVCADFPDVAVVVITPPAKLRQGILAMLDGASGYIQTPLQPDTVIAGLRSALMRKQLDTAARQ